MTPYDSPYRWCPVYTVPAYPAAVLPALWDACVMFILIQHTAAYSLSQLEFCSTRTP